MKNISLTVDGLRLIGDVFRSQTDKKQPGVLFIHGWESQRKRTDMLAQELAGLGYCCLSFDMRGHGESEGDHTTASRKDFLRDVVAAYDFLAGLEGVDTENITAVGSSFGSYLAANLSAERKVRNLALRVPANYRDEGFDEALYGQRKRADHSDWKTRPHQPTETRALRAVHAFKGNMLIVESEKDELVPATTVRSYESAATNAESLKYTVMKDAPHSIGSLPCFQREYADVVKGWLISIR